MYFSFIDGKMRGSKRIRKFNLSDMREIYTTCYYTLKSNYWTIKLKFINLKYKIDRLKHINKNIYIHIYAVIEIHTINLSS